MKATMKSAALFLALSAIPFAASAQDWQGDHGHDRGQQQQRSDNGGQQRNWRGDRGGNNDGNRSQADRGNRDYANRWQGDRNQGDRNWQQRGNPGGYIPRPPMPPQAGNYYNRGYAGYSRGRDYRYAPPPRAYYPNNYGRRYYSVGYGYRPEPVWTVGNVYYGDDYAPTYSVADYGDYGLYAPPRGYAWRRDDFGHFLLVAITSGIIADLLLGH